MVWDNYKVMWESSALYLFKPCIRLSRCLVLIEQILLAAKVSEQEEVTDRNDNSHGFEYKSFINQVK